MIPQTTGASQLDEVVGETMKAQGAAANVRILGWQCCLKIFQLHSWNATYFRHFRMIEGVFLGVYSGVPWNQQIAKNS